MGRRRRLRSLFAIARDDDVTFGILCSRIHEIWATAQGNRLGVGNQRRYNIGVAFETFPFPIGLDPTVSAADCANDPRGQRIAAAAARLNELRLRWLNPPDLVRNEPEVVRNYPDRIIPINEAAEETLKRRTLTNLYNERPAWLATAHAELDGAVAEAYNLSRDASDEAVLTRLLEMNHAGAEAAPQTQDEASQTAGALS